MIETPTIANGTAYVMQGNGMVYVLDATTYDQIWTFNTGKNAWATTSEEIIACGFENTNNKTIIFIFKLLQK